MDWKRVKDAESYVLRLSWANGHHDYEGLTAGGRFNDLRPNRIYSATLRAINAQGTSDWSAALNTCTRPPIPPAPRQGYTDAFSATPSVLLDWNLIDFVSDLDDPGQLRVGLGRRREGGAIANISQDFKLFDRFIDTDFKEGDEFFLKLIYPSSCAPGGLNVSDWGVGLKPSTLFGDFRSVGAASSESISVMYMRSYYG